MTIRSIIAALLAVCAFAGARAYDFSATVDGKRLYFNITDKDKKTACVTYSGSIKNKKVPSLSGVVKIPAKVKHHNVIYTISEVGRKAFANETGLKGVVIPDGVESIRDFAFEGCDSLRSIIFPSNAVKFGEGVFFRCTGIEDVALGADWTGVNLAMFRWSNALDSISIPAKIEDIRGLEKLKGLKKVNVVAENANFSSHSGMLYDKSGKTLYRCPRGYSGKVVVEEGTEKIAEGALIDCVGITWLDFPASLKSVSFRETSRMDLLEGVIMRSEEPLINAYIGGEGRLLFMLRNRSASILVLLPCLPAYREVLATEAGEYSATPDGLPYIVKSDVLPSKKNLEGVKNF